MVLSLGSWRPLQSMTTVLCSQTQDSTERMHLHLKTEGGMFWLRVDSGVDMEWNEHGITNRYLDKSQSITTRPAAAVSLAAITTMLEIIMNCSSTNIIASSTNSSSSNKSSGSSNTSSGSSNKSSGSSNKSSSSRSSSSNKSSSNSSNSNSSSSSSSSSYWPIRFKGAHGRPEMAGPALWARNMGREVLGRWSASRATQNTPALWGQRGAFTIPRLRRIKEGQATHPSFKIDLVFQSFSGPNNFQVQVKFDLEYSEHGLVCWNNI
ncbi:hypothetical protein FHG87_014065 [Trinorchestia longiramus]|nr:hypothetical protein FHG87_014065 [Trinorchestia longiramus]